MKQLQYKQELQVREPDSCFDMQCRSVDGQVNMRSATTTKAVQLQAHTLSKLHGKGTDQMFDCVCHEHVQCLAGNTPSSASSLSHHNLQQAILLWTCFGKLKQKQ